MFLFGVPCIPLAKHLVKQRGKHPKDSPDVCVLNQFDRGNDSLQASDEREVDVLALTCKISSGLLNFPELAPPFVLFFAFLGSPLFSTNQAKHRAFCRGPNSSQVNWRPDLHVDAGL